ncbi:phage tail protein [Zobellella denitrificans]|uniref:DUF2586 domain-containing protein n=1 Tax=Zobellella denitrificans TaxID=347534 RepID=UPI000B8BB6C7|nr:DUF2586 domain-containing protein [Zobellella denitrificans]OXS14007.1 phage tail protein [Zobellella denitrificans]
MWPTIQVNNLNQMQGPTNEVERHFLFVGKAGKNTGKLLSLNTQSDLDDLLGTQSSTLKTNVRAAMLNAGQNWTAHAYVLPNDADWTEAVLDVQQTASFEAVALVEPVSTAEQINAAQALYHQLIATWGRWQFMMLAVPGIDSATQDWPTYEATMAALQNGIAADGVMLVPQLHGNNVGVLAGRLCNRAVTVADTPMRVKTGPVLALGPAPKDSADTELTLATLQTLEANRYSVPAWYPDYDGVYWADGNMLDVEGGDFQSVENRRVIDKCARKMRIRGIARLGDRQLNSTPASMAAAKLYFMQDLRAMSKSVTIAGQTFPGEIMPPEDEDITIEWLSKYEVAIYALAQPYDCPKKIAINLMLDLSNPGDSQ